MTHAASLSDRLSRELPELLELRRHLHAHPELSGEEHQTAALVAGELRQLGWRVREGVGRTGVVAELGPDHGPTVGLRVDMDALPVEERTGLSYASTRQGLMHACGHDLHTCTGLGVARLLAQEQALAARVRLLFQPAEELAQGAVWMRDAGRWKALMPCTASMWCQTCRWARWGSVEVVLRRRPESWRSWCRGRAVMVLVPISRWMLFG